MLFHFDRDLVGLLSQAVCLTDFIVIVPTQSDCDHVSSNFPNIISLEVLFPANVADKHDIL